jgi:hypothetical protein
VIHDDREYVHNLLAKLSGVRPDGKGWKARCPVPAHGDKNPSLSIAVGNNGAILLKCRSKGCSAKDIMAAVGMDLRDLFAPSANGTGKHISATYDYRDESGTLLYQVVRFEPKDFRQRKPDGNGGWTWKTKDVRKVPYRLPEVLAAPVDEPLFWCEGEKAVDALVKIGLQATCTPTGAGKAKYTDPAALKAVAVGRTVPVLEDNDSAGEAHAADVVNRIQPDAAKAFPFKLPNLPPKGDVFDWIQAGGTREKLLELIGQVAQNGPTGGTNGVINLSSHNSLSSHSLSEREWPEPLAPEACIGPLADYVRAVEPMTESDPAAVLLQSLIMFGNIIGRTAFLPVEADCHFTNEFLVLVGETNGGRKGTSKGVARAAFALADQTWLTRWTSGLSSGEGLIWFVRDPIEKQERVEEKGRPVRYETVIADKGVEDKRAMVIEPEFVGVLKQTERQGNTLSAIVRQAWETGYIQTMTKNSPAKTTNAHISIVGHITEAELKKHLSEVETANGFANRFLWIVVRRSKFLPESPPVNAEAVKPALTAIASAVAFAKSQRQIHRDADAVALWRELYPVLERDRGGLAGAMTARAAAHVVRLSLLYALTERSPVIRDRHLAAAVAVWEFTERSVAYLFGDSTGDGYADDALSLIRSCPAGIKRGDILNFFGRHVSSERLTQALRTLVRLGRARCETVETGGRPAEWWYAVEGGRS